MNRCVNASIETSIFHFQGLEASPNQGMLSYPDSMSLNRALNHPDVFTMSMLAEISNLDLRILVIQRDAKDILRSTSKKMTSRFGGNVEPETLIANAEALYTQLKMLDRSFYHCVHYTKLASLNKAQSQKMADFLHPTIMKDAWQYMIEAVKYPNETSTSTPDYFPEYHHHHSGGGGGSGSSSSSSSSSNNSNNSNNTGGWHFLNGTHMNSNDTNASNLNRTHNHRLHSPVEWLRNESHDTSLAPRNRSSHALRNQSNQTSEALRNQSHHAYWALRNESRAADEASGTPGTTHPRRRTSDHREVATTSAGADFGRSGSDVEGSAVIRDLGTEEPRSVESSQRHSSGHLRRSARAVRSLQDATKYAAPVVIDIATTTAASAAAAVAATTPPPAVTDTQGVSTSAIQGSAAANMIGTNNLFAAVSNLGNSSSIINNSSSGFAAMPTAPSLSPSRQRHNITGGQPQLGRHHNSSATNHTSSSNSSQPTRQAPSGGGAMGQAGPHPAGGGRSGGVSPVGPNTPSGTAGGTSGGTVGGPSGSGSSNLFSRIPGAHTYHLPPWLEQRLSGGAWPWGGGGGAGGAAAAPETPQEAAEEATEAAAYFEFQLVARLALIDDLCALDPSGANSRPASTN